MSTWHPAKVPTMAKRRPPIVAVIDDDGNTTHEIAPSLADVGDLSPTVLRALESLKTGTPDVVNDAFDKLNDAPQSERASYEHAQRVFAYEAFRADQQMQVVARTTDLMDKPKRRLRPQTSVTVKPETIAILKAYRVEFGSVLDAFAAELGAGKAPAAILPGIKVRKVAKRGQNVVG